MTAFPPPTSKSIEDQLNSCRDFAARHGWVVVETYFDAGRSGPTPSASDCGS